MNAAVYLNGQKRPSSSFLTLMFRGYSVSNSKLV